MNLLMCLAHSPGGTTREVKKALRVGRVMCYSHGTSVALRVGRTRMLVPHPCKSRHQREEEHLRVLILSSLESPLLSPRADEIR